MAPHTISLFSPKISYIFYIRKLCFYDFFPLKLSVFLLVHNFCSHNLIISALTTTSRCIGPLAAGFLYPLQLLVSSLCVVAPCINCLLTTFEPCPLHHLSYPYPDPDGLGITHHHYSIHLLCITPPMS